ncbi:MAG: glutamate racemase [Mangrovibacterium sp.]
MAGNYHPIGVFDSGYGGLTVLRELVRALPQYDFVYLGDNARTPYGTRSFEVVYRYTLEAVKKLFDIGCPMVILACNTASAKALRTIQQRDLPRMAPGNRVLGVIRPSVEHAAEVSRNGHVGVLATNGTVASHSYPVELEKWSGGKIIRTSQQACPMWVPLVENRLINTPGADYFIRTDMNRLFEQDPAIDSLILGCTHYPLLLDGIRKYLPGSRVNLIEQGPIVAGKLADYLQRHPEMEKRCSRGGAVAYYTTEQVELFEAQALQFMGQAVKAGRIHF